jgi:hypothetical protein
MATKHKREQERRKRQDDIHDPHDDRVEPFWREAGDQTDEDAARRSEDDHADADEEGELGAVEQARDEIAAERVGAEDVGPRTAILPDRRHQRRRPVLGGRVVGRNEAGGQGQNNQHGENIEADHRPLVLAEIAPELAEAAGAGGHGIQGCVSHVSAFGSWD